MEHERADAGLVEEIRRGLARRAEPARAPAMQAYMKSTLPYRGVPSAPLRAFAKAAFAAHPLPDAESWRHTVLALWRGAAYREERYAAIALTGHRTYRAYQTCDLVSGPDTPLYDELIVTGAWWDYVDELAIRRVGPILAADRAALTPVLLAWSRDDDLWRRRSSIICQVGAKEDTDLDLLVRCIEPNLADREFFIRKAIGWALRAYAWIDPDWVRSWVTAHRDQLSGLSRREALKNIT
jgi:3-methyladenine DNA glycosylase AlkD